MTTKRNWTLGARLGRREFIKLAGFGAGAAALAACGPAGTTPTPAGGATGSAPTAAAGQTSITFWTPGGSDTFCAGFDTIGANFTAIEPGIAVLKECNAGGVEDYNTVLQAAIAAGNPPDSTIIWTSPVTYAAVNAVEPLDEMMAASKYSQVENWPEAVLASCQWKGKVYGLPVAAGSYGMFYNQEALEAKGIPSGRADFPKTWDELRRLSAEFVQWDGDTLVNAGFLPWSDNVQLNIWSALNGSQIYDGASGKYTIDSEQNIEMMQFALDWLEEQYKGDWVKVQASDNWGGYADNNGRPPAFQGGRLAGLDSGFWFTGDIYGAEFNGWSRWEVAPYPVGPSGTKTVSGYWPNWLVIPKGSKHIPEAFKYLDYMSVEGIKVWFSAVPDLPTNKLVPTDLIPQLVIDKRGEEFGADVTAFFHQQLEIATPMWNSPVVEFGHDQLSTAIDAVLNKTATPQDALTAAQQASQAELERVLKTAS
jgi:multiple sugar transport system substrate-binding protein